ncbi:MAG: iron-containing alcohol dehydrogenase, partial [Bacillota bacterium]
YQGFDALFHSTEGYLNKTANEMSDLFSLKSISLIGNSLAKAVADGSNEAARADIALANTFAGIVESTSGCISEHSIEHALSAFHPKLPHGAGLIMISIAYYMFLVQSGSCDQRLVDMAKALGKKGASEPLDFVIALRELQRDCGVDKLKMSDYGIQREEIPKIAQNARDTMGALYQVDPCTISLEDTIKILEESYL